MKSLKRFFIIFCLFSLALFILTSLHQADKILESNHFSFEQSDLPEPLLFHATLLTVDFPSPTYQRIPKRVGKVFTSSWGYSRDDLAKTYGIEKVSKVEPLPGTPGSILAGLYNGYTDGVYGEPLIENFVYLGTDRKYDAAIECTGASRTCTVSFDGCKTYPVRYLGFITRQVRLGTYTLARQALPDFYIGLPGYFIRLHKAIVDGTCQRQKMG